MIFINENALDLNTIKLPNGTYYSGADEIKLMFAGAWEEIDKKFFYKGQKVIFKTPGIKSGNGKGNQGYGMPRVVKYKTRKGMATIAWADDIIKENNKVRYSPILKRIGLNEKTLILGPEDIEQVLFMFLFNPEMNSVKNPLGSTFLEDKEAEAMKYAEKETQSAVVSYWLFREESPFYSNETRISTLCLAWGINPENKSIIYKKQLLAEAIKSSEKKNDPEFNLKAFNKICEKMKDGQDTKEIEVMALIHKCVLNNVIKFDKDKLAWVLLGPEGKSLKTICKVPPPMVNVSKNVIKKYLLTAPDDVQVLQAAADMDSLDMNSDFVELSVPLPDPEEMTEEFITGDSLSWHDKKALFKFLGNDTKHATKETIHPILIEYFVLNKRTVEFKVK